MIRGLGRADLSSPLYYIGVSMSVCYPNCTGMAFLRHLKFPYNIASLGNTLLLILPYSLGTKCLQTFIGTWLGSGTYDFHRRIISLPGILLKKLQLFFPRTYIPINYEIQLAKKS